MMVGPSKVYSEHVAGYPVVEEPQQQRLPGVPDDDGDEFFMIEKACWDVIIWV